MPRVKTLGVFFGARPSARAQEGQLEARCWIIQCRAFAYLRGVREYLSELLTA
jgi:hypothetical protein